MQDKQTSYWSEIYINTSIKNRDDKISKPTSFPSGEKTNKQTKIWGSVNDRQWCTEDKSCLKQKTTWAQICWKLQNKTKQKKTNKNKTYHHTSQIQCKIYFAIPSQKFGEEINQKQQNANTREDASKQAWETFPSRFIFSFSTMFRVVYV